MVYPRHILSRGLVLILLTGLISVTRADLVAQFAFDGNSLSSTDPSTSWSTDALASGGGVPLAFDGSLGNPSPSLAFSMGDINDGTLLDDDYYFFTVTPDGGVSLDYTKLTVDVNKISGGADVFGRLYTSEDGFISEVGFFNESVEADGFTNYEIDLGAIGVVSSPTTFRMYLETSGTFGPNGIRMDNLEVSANVIPEPATLTLLGLGALALGLVRRRRTA